MTALFLFWLGAEGIVLWQQSGGFFCLLSLCDTQAYVLTAPLSYATEYGKKYKSLFG